MKCRKNTETKNPKVVKTKNRRIMLLSECTVCDSKISKFIKQQEARGLLSKLTGIIVPILSDLPIANISFQKYKMNAIVNKLLLAGDKFMPEMNLRQPGFTYGACELFTKNKKRIKKIKETGDSRYIYQNKLDKACFQNAMANGDYKYLNRRTAADKVLHDKAFNITKFPKYQCGLDSMVYKFFHKKTSGWAIKKGIMQDEELAKELH